MEKGAIGNVLDDYINNVSNSDTESDLEEDEAKNIKIKK